MNSVREALTELTSLMRSPSVRSTPTVKLAGTSQCNSVSSSTWMSVYSAIASMRSSTATMHHAISPHPCILNNKSYTVHALEPGLPDAAMLCACATCVHEPFTLGLYTSYTCRQGVDVETFVHSVHYLVGQAHADLPFAVRHRLPNLIAHLLRCLHANDTRERAAAVKANASAT